MKVKTGNQLKLTDEATRNEANQRLKKHLNLQAVGYECTTEMVLDVLIRAAVNRQTIETAAIPNLNIEEGQVGGGESSNSSCFNMKSSK